MKKHYDGILFNLIEFLQVKDLLSASSKDNDGEWKWFD